MDFDDPFFDEDEVFIAMEFIQGQSLAHLIGDDGLEPDLNLMTHPLDRMPQHVFFFDDVVEILHQRDQGTLEEGQALGRIECDVE